MIDRQTMYYYVGLTVLCIMVVVSVVFYVKPRLETKLPPISKVAASTTKGQLERRDIASTSLGMMKNKEGELKPMEPIDAMRNPFLWYGELKPQKAVTAPSVPKSIPRLGMIIIGQKSRLAFLDEKLVYEGRQHEGYYVEKIAPRAVTLSNAYGKLQLIAPEDHFGPAKVKRVERSRP